MQFTGLGLLTPILMLAIIVLSFSIASDFSQDMTQVLLAAAVMVPLSALHLVFGLLFNTKRTPTRLQWTNYHTFAGFPLQYGCGIQLLIALMIASWSVGNLTSPVYGWLLFAGVIVGTIVGFNVVGRIGKGRVKRTM